MSAINNNYCHNTTNIEVTKNRLDKYPNSEKLKRSENNKEILNSILMVKLPVAFHINTGLQQCREKKTLLLC